MNETNWWDKRPYRTCGYPAEHDCFCEDATYDIPAIVQAVREEERKETTARFETASESMARIYTCGNCLSKQIRKKYLFCPHCGLKIKWE